MFWFLLISLCYSGVRGGTETNDHDIVVSQAIRANSSGDGSCVKEGRCKPCSHFEMTKQVKECLKTGYRQLAYCPNAGKGNKYVSCHYIVDPQAQKIFWLYQMCFLFIGSVSLAVVFWRQAKLQRTMTARIEQQIRA